MTKIIGSSMFWPRLAELVSVFVAIPIALYFYGTRWNVHVCLWVFSCYALVGVSRAPGFSWHRLWHGVGWSTANKTTAFVRFCAATPLIVVLTYTIAPDRLFSFPIERPWFWLLVMVLYPLLSVIPQEMVFRRYFFERYHSLFPTPWALICASAFCFGFVHIIFHNVVSPLLSFLAGLMIAHSYTQHRSLKWAVLEHGAYGCMVFTVGIGFYFLVGGWRP
jgi:uncharacterized protein